MKPNILFIMTDQQRWDCIAANGNKIIQTPNLDRLAARSVNFSHACVQAPVCVPSRVSFFTGRYPRCHRNRVNYTPLDPRETLMQQQLRDAGYRTGVVGKLHYYPATPEEARRTGFDFVELHDAVPFCDPWSDYVKWQKAQDPSRKSYYRALAKDIAPGCNPFRTEIPDALHETTWTGLRTRHHLEELAKGSQPFFLFSSFFKPHADFELPAPFADMYNHVEIPLPPTITTEDIQKLPAPLRRLVEREDYLQYNNREWLQWIYRSYYGAITQIDREVGLMLDTLEQTGLADNTIIVFTSDHGDQLCEHGIMGKNCFYDSSIRVPFMISYPGRIRPGASDELVESIDLLPTLFELAGVPEPYANQGTSLVPLLQPGSRAYTSREAVFCENIIPEVITSGKYDWEFRKGSGIKDTRHPDAKMVRTRRWKFNYYPDGYAELYDLQNDPAENCNLHGQPAYRDIEYEMKDRILHWLSTADEPDQIAPRWLLP